MEQPSPRFGARLEFLGGVATFHMTNTLMLDRLLKIFQTVERMSGAAVKRWLVNVVRIGQLPENEPRRRSAADSQWE
jgi:hypothetical protein